MLLIVTAAALANPGRLRTLLKRSDVRRWLLASGLTGAVSAAWTVAVALPNQIAYSPIGVRQALGRTGMWLGESVLQVGTLDVHVPALVYLIWGLAASALLLGAILAGRRKRLVVLLALLVVVFALPVTSSGLGLPRVGYVWQGRFGLPLLVGTVILAAAIAEQLRLPRVIVPLALTGLMIAQVAAFVAAVRRYDLPGHGMAFFTLFTHPRWRPAIAPVLSLALLVAGLITASLVAGRRGRRGRWPGTRSPEQMAEGQPS
jgi:hypothetical protein